MVSQMYNRWGDKMISKIILNPKIIISPLATETRQVIDDINLPGRGIVVHHKTSRAFPAVKQIDSNTILIHPEIEQKLYEGLYASIGYELDAALLGGKNG